MSGGGALSRCTRTSSRRRATRSASRAARAGGRAPGARDHGSAAEGRRAIVNPADGVLTFHADDTPLSGDKLAAAYVVDGLCREIEVEMAT